MPGKGPDISRRKRVAKGAPLDAHGRKPGQFAPENKRRGPDPLLDKWERYGFTNASEWEAEGFDADTAIKWANAALDPFDRNEARCTSLPVSQRPECKIKIDPQTAREWRDAGFDAWNAGDWMRNAPSFSAADARRWYRAGFLPKDAAKWGETAGFSPERARQWINAWWFSDPHKAARWDLSGFAPREAQKWVECGFNNLDRDYPAVWRAGGFDNPSEAQKWKNAGFNHAQALSWVEAGINVDEAQRAENKLHHVPAMYLHGSSDDPQLDLDPHWDSIAYADDWRRYGFSHQAAMSWRKCGYCMPQPVVDLYQQFIEES